MIDVRTFHIERNWPRKANLFGRNRQLLSHHYRPQRSCGQGNVFTGVCHSFCSQGGRGSASVHAGIPPPGTRQTPPGTRQTPPGSDTPSGPGRHPPPPPGPGRPPQGKQTPAYGLRAAGTHPTGMHSCLKKSSPAWAKILCRLVLVQPIQQTSFAHTTIKILKRSFWVPMEFITRSVIVFTTVGILNVNVAQKFCFTKFLFKSF